MFKYIKLKSVLAIFLVFSFMLYPWSSSPHAYSADTGPLIDKEVLANIEEEEYTRVIVFFNDPLPVAPTEQQGQDNSAAAVVETLQEQTRKASSSITDILNAEIDKGNIKNYQSLWIVNAFAAQINNAALHRLAALPQIESIRPDRNVTLSPGTATSELDDIIMSGEEGEHTGEIPWNLQLINAPSAWQEEITGKDITVAIMDTGVDQNHPALENKYRGNMPGHSHATSWFDATDPSDGTEGPRDPYGHGTHVAGIIMGGSPREPLGVAPDANWIGVNIFDDGTTWDSHITRAFQWLLAPDGDPTNAPQIINCSWASRPEYVSDYLQWEILHNLEQAGIFVVFAAGNNGEQGPGSPASYPHAFCAGALTKEDDTIKVAPFSSRGPVTWQGMSYIKPEITAPGTKIRSAWLNGEYRVLDGTSTAAAHVSGTAALLMNARPDMTPAEIGSSLKQTASWHHAWNEQGERPNGTYGYGLLDVAAAVHAQKPDPRERERELLFFDGADEGIMNWSTSPRNPWKITREKVYDGEFAFADSPWGEYQNNDSSWLALSEPISLCGYYKPVLTFQHFYDLPRGEKREDDYAVVELSTDGRNWMRLYRFYGSNEEYTESSIPLKLPADARQFFLRFRLQSNGNGPGTGWYIDNIGVTARPRPLSDLEELVIVPERDIMGIDEEIKVSAEAFFCETHSKPLDPDLLEWHSSDPEVATVDEGTVTALKAGKAEIRGEFSGRTAQIPLEIIEVPPPAADPAPDTYINEVAVELETAMPDTKIYYTLDGSEPDHDSYLYEKPISITETTVLKTRAYFEDIPGDLAVLPYTVKEGGTVNGSLQLQQRPFSKANVELYAVCQAEERRYKINTLDSSGNFSIELPLGDYKMVAKRPQYLAVVEPFELAEKGEHSLPRLLLLAGDINNDNHIGLKDLTLLARAYDTTPDDEHWDPRADLNGNGRVDIADLTILTRNYGESTNVP